MTASGRPVPQERIDAIRRNKGCFEPIKFSIDYHRHENISFSRCVCNYYDNEITTLIDMRNYYNHYLKLPDQYIYKTGKVFNKTIQAVKIVDYFIKNHEAKVLEKERQKIQKSVNKK